MDDSLLQALLARQASPMPRMPGAVPTPNAVQAGPQGQPNMGLLQQLLMKMRADNSRPS